jgi:hypothetical protein
MFKVGKEYRVKNLPNELGKEFQWMIGKTVKIEGELIVHGKYRKYPISHDMSLVPNDGVSRPASRIREDLLEEIIE